MKSLFPYVRYLGRITGSIAFLPTIISMLFLILGITFLYIEEKESFHLLKNQIDFAIIKSADTARNLLGILIGGVISLMVFSFSMVMVVLSQALSSLSPRIIPGLISDKRHQGVLGFYLGTLFYLFLVMINLRPGNEIVFIQLNVLLAIVCGITCLILFTYFIHTISQGIQVDVILEDIFHRTKHQLNKIEHAQEEQHFSDEVPSEYIPVLADREGYYNGFNKEAVVDFCQKYDCKLIIIIRWGAYVYPHTPIGYISKEVSKDDADWVSKQLFLDNTIPDDHYLYGLKYITEIGIKALSPGINDPGTALKAINFLTVLIQLKMNVVEKNYYMDSTNMIRIVFKPLDLPTLIYHFYTPFRNYGANDLIVMQSMLSAFTILIQTDQQDKKYVSVLRDFVLAIGNDLGPYLHADVDRLMCNAPIDQMNQLGYFSTPIPSL